jgi:hypothetical protein
LLPDGADNCDEFEGVGWLRPNSLHLLPRGASNCDKFGAAGLPGLPSSDGLMKFR